MVVVEGGWSHRAVRCRAGAAGDEISSHHRRRNRTGTPPDEVSANTERSTRRRKPPVRQPAASFRYRAGHGFLKLGGCGLTLRVRDALACCRQTDEAPTAMAGASLLCLLRLHQLVDSTRGRHADHRGFPAAAPRQTRLGLGFPS